MTVQTCKEMYQKAAITAINGGKVKTLKRDFMKIKILKCL